MKYLIFRQNFPLEGPNSSIEVVSLGSRVTNKAQRDLLAQRIVKENSLPKVIEDSESAVDEHYSTWIENGWGFSFPFQISTLDRTYRDTGDDFKKVHDETLTLYAEKDPIPSEHYPEGVSIPLPRSIVRKGGEVGQVLSKRRTSLVPKGGPVSFQELANILMRGMEKLSEFREFEKQSHYKNAMVNFGPSLDVYVVAYKVDGLDSGVYRFNLLEGTLIKLSSHADRLLFRKALVGQPAPMTSSVSIVYVSEIQRHQWRYRHSRGLRGLWIDSAKVVNELLWVLASIDIVPHITPAFNDSLMCELLELPADMSFIPIYSITFGEENG